eukprot:SAG31_NODE_27047_length_432_cov_0.771772_1_plen_97_part_10
MVKQRGGGSRRKVAVNKHDNPLHSDTTSLNLTSDDDFATPTPGARAPGIPKNEWKRGVGDGPRWSVAFSETMAQEGFKKYVDVPDFEFDRLLVGGGT